MLTFNSYKPKEFTLEEESQPKSELSAKSSSPAIYSGIQDVTLAQIKNIDIDGSFGTKIDTLARHIMWIRANDPGAKSIVFSQFRDFLDVLAKAFAQFKIAFTGIDRKDGIEKFKEDASVCSANLIFYAHAMRDADKFIAGMFFSSCEGSFIRTQPSQCHACFFM